MTATHSAAYLCPDYNASIPTESSTKTPLQMLAQTCNSIGSPNPHGKGKIILPLDCDTSLSKPGRGVEKSPLKNEEVTSSAAVSGKPSPSHRSKDVSSTSVDAPSEKVSTSGRLTSPPSKATKDRPSPVNPPTPPSGETAPSAGFDTCNKSPTFSSSVGQALPPTLPPSASAPKCSSCLPAHPFMFPIMPSANSAVAAYGPFSHQVPTALARNGYDLSALQAAAAASMSQFPCLDPCCKQCPTTGSAVGMGSHMLPVSTATPFGASCPFACTQYPLPNHSELWRLSAYPFLAAAATGMSGVPSLPGLTHPGAIPTSIPSLAPTLLDASMKNFYGQPVLGTAPAVSLASSAPDPARNSEKLHVCNWVCSDNTTCGKNFATADELCSHVLSTHTKPQENPRSPGTSTAASVTPASAIPAVVTNPLGSAHSAIGDRSRYSPKSSCMNNFTFLSALNRYHPYKAVPNLGSTPPLLSHLPIAPSMPTATVGHPLSAFCGQRLLGTLPHP